MGDGVPAIAALERTGALLNGHFLLSSGRHSDRYCQCARVFEHPSEAAGLAADMARTLRDGGVDPQVVVAPALGGVLWGYELARALGVRSVFVEREAGGGFQLRRGFAIDPGERVVMAEDVVTTGGSVLEAAQVVKAHGGDIVAYASVVDRSNGAFSSDAPFFALAALSFETFERDACPMCKAGEAVVKPGSRALSTGGNG